MALSFRISRFRETHLDGVLTIAERAWEAVFAGLKAELPPFVYRSFYPDGWQRRHRQNIEAVCRANDTPVWVALAGKRVIGFVGIRTHAEDAMGEVHIVGVDPAYQGHGIGRALVAFALERMREKGLSFALAETGGDNGHASARRFYEAAGFQRWDVVRYVREL